MEKKGIPSHALYPTAYYQASDDATFPSIDSMSIQGMFKVTVAQEHPVRGTQLLSRICELYLEPRLYFVVPPYRFDMFKVQPFLEGRGSSRVNPIPGLRQFVLKLPVSPQLGSP